EPGSRQAGFGGGGEHVIGEAAERGLRVGTGERGQGQAERDVPAAAERLPVVSASGMGRVASQRGGLEQPDRLRVRGQPPAGLPAQPAAERRQVPPDQHERLGVVGGDEQRLGEQGAEGALALRLFLGGDHGTTSVISMTCSGPVSTPSSVLMVAVPPSGTRRSRTSRLPSLVMVFTSVLPGARAASASPSRLRKRRNALGSSTSRSDSSVGPLVCSRRRASAVCAASSSAWRRSSSLAVERSLTWLGWPRRS